MKELVVGVALRIIMVGSICGGLYIRPMLLSFIILIIIDCPPPPQKKRTSMFRETLIPIKQL